MIFSEGEKARREVGLWGHCQERGERERMRGGRRGWGASWPGFEKSHDFV